MSECSEAIKIGCSGRDMEELKTSHKNRLTLESFHVLLGKEHLSSQHSGLGEPVGLRGSFWPWKGLRVFTHVYVYIYIYI